MPKAASGTLVNKRSRANLQSPAVRFTERTTVNAEAGTDGRISRAERFAGPTDLPLEVLVIIARFIAGNNNYGTLLAFCLMCKCVRDELKSTFYETVLYPDTNYLQSKFGNQLGLEEYRHTKFLFVPKLVFRPNAEGMEKLFPKLQVMFLLPNATYGVKPRQYNEEKPEYQCELRIHRPVLSETMSSLLRAPLHWKGTPRSEGHPIRAISSVVLEKEGVLIGETPPREDVIFNNHVKDCVIDTRKCARPENISESLRELGRFTPLVRKASTDSPSLKLWVNPGPHLDACLANLSDIALRQAGIIFSIEIDNQHSFLTRAEFQERCRDVASTYKRIWKEIDFKSKLARPQHLTDRTLFFEMGHATTRQAPRHGDNRPMLEFIANFECTTEAESFFVTIWERDDNTNEETVVLEEEQVIED